MYRRVLVGLSAALLAAASLVGLDPISAAAAEPLGCGATIYASTKLVSDLLNCAGNGITIGADNVSLDLNGHTIDGQGGGIGVDVGGHHAVKVKNGRIKEFDVGVRFGEGSNHNELDDLTICNNRVGVLLQSSYGNDIETNVVKDNRQAGILLVESHDNVVENNKLMGNGSRFVDEVAPTNGFGECPGGGIVLDESANNDIHKNTASGNTIGIVLCFSSANAVTSNLTTGNGIGIELLSSNLNGIEGNLASSNGIGILLGSGFGQGGSSPESPSGNLLKGNQAQGNDEDGILVEGDAVGHTVLNGNRTDGNGDDGIDVDSSNATITSNRANQNSDWGIEAVEGVTDGGGNKASGNGQPGQCLNVVCTA